MFSHYLWDPSSALLHVLRRRPTTRFPVHISVF